MKIINTLNSAFLFLFLISNFVLAQTDVKDNSVEEQAKIRAKDIITKSREYTNKKIKVADIKNIMITYESKLPPIDRFDESISNVELSVLFPDKVYSYGKGEASQTLSISTSILNGDNYDKKLETFSGGKPLNATFDFGTKESQKREFKFRTWTFVFPITLDSWYYPFEFKFIAIAESKDGKAEVLEAISPTSKTVYRLFFDQESHLLLLMTRNFQTNENKKVEDKYFFSDYKEDNGIIIAHKIEYQQNGELIETRTIKAIKINSEFKSDLFDIKVN